MKNQFNPEKQGHIELSSRFAVIFRLRTSDKPAEGNKPGYASQTLFAGVLQILQKGQPRWTMFFEPTTY